MVRRFLKIAAAACLALGAIASVPSCADNHESIFIFGVVAVQPPDCVAKADTGAKLWSNGIMELAITDSYGNYVLVGNQLIARGDPQKIAAEPNRVQVTGAEITLTGVDGHAFGPTYSVSANGLVSPTTSADASYAPVFVQMIPAAKGQEIGAYLKSKGAASLTILADIKIFGQTLGLTNVETGVYTFSIVVTNGGTIVQTRNVAGAIDCTSIPTTTTFTATCFPGQDANANPCYYTCQKTPTGPGC